MTAAAQKSQESIKVTAADLPLSCPNRHSDPAALHPRVFIRVKKPGDRATCPYCGAVYELTA